MLSLNTPQVIQSLHTDIDRALRRDYNTSCHGTSTWGWSTCVWPSCSPSSTFQAFPTASPHLQNRSPEGKPLPPISSPIKCTSAMMMFIRQSPGATYVKWPMGGYMRGGDSNEDPCACAHILQSGGVEGGVAGRSACFVHKIIKPMIRK